MHLSTGRRRGTCNLGAPGISRTAGGSPAGGQTPGRNGGVRESLRPPERSEELQEAIETVEAIIEGADSS